MHRDVVNTVTATKYVLHPLGEGSSQLQLVASMETGGLVWTSSNIWLAASVKPTLYIDVCPLSALSVNTY